MGRNTSPVKEDRHAGAKLVYETIKGLKNKAEKSGMPYSILKKFTIEVWQRGEVVIDQHYTTTMGIC